MTQLIAVRDTEVVTHRVIHLECGCCSENEYTCHAVKEGEIIEVPEDNDIVIFVSTDESGTIDWNEDFKDFKEV